MLTGAISAAIIWLAAVSPEFPAMAAPEIVQPAIENIYYVQLDGMT